MIWNNRYRIKLIIRRARIGVKDQIIDLIGCDDEDIIPASPNRLGIHDILRYSRTCTSS